MSNQVGKPGTGLARRALCAGMGVLLAGGCAMPPAGESRRVRAAGPARPGRAEVQAAAYDAYLRQARTYPAVRVQAAEGASMTISMAGVGMVEMTGPLPPLAAPVPPEAAWASLGRALGTVAQWAGIAYLGRAYTRGARTTTTSSTQGVEVIEVPAAGTAGAARPFLNPAGP